MLDDFKVIKDEVSVPVFIELDKNAEAVWREYKQILTEEEHNMRKKERFLEIKERDFLIMSLTFIQSSPKEYQKISASITL